jgi:hypothetical protein
MLTTTKYEELSHLITDRNVLRELRGVSKQIWKLASGGGGTGGGGRGGGGGKQWQQHCPVAAQGVPPMTSLSPRLPSPITGRLDGARLCPVILTRVCTDETLEGPTPCSATIA